MRAYGFACLSILLLTGCAAPQPPANVQHSQDLAADRSEPEVAAPIAVVVTTIAVGSNSASVEGVDLAAARWMALHPDVNVNVVRGLGSGGSIQAVSVGELDFTIASRPIKEKEAGLGLVQTWYVNEAIVLLGHPQAGVRSITSEQLAGVYAGRITNWRELGGNDLPLLLVTREKDDSEIERIIERWPALDNEWGSDVRLVDTDFDKLELLRANLGAIGFADAIQVGLAQTDLVSISIDDVAYNNAARADGTYPLTMRFHLVAPPDLSGPAREFHDYLTSQEWQEALALAGTKVS